MPTGVWERTAEHNTATSVSMGGVGHRSPPSPTYHSWRAMKKRCSDPNTNGFQRYGGRGITVDPRWESFINFLADLGERPEGKTLDRIDSDGNYEPGNCRWATRSEQRRNQA